MRGVTSGGRTVMRTGDVRSGGHVDPCHLLPSDRDPDPAMQCCLPHVCKQRLIVALTSP